MKIRNGFVSNSSSSSFVVAFKERPETMEELQRLLFPDDQSRYPDPYSHDWWPIGEVTQTVWRDLQGQEPLTPEQVAEVLGDAYVYEEEVEGSLFWDPVPGPQYPETPPYDPEKSLSDSPEYLERMSRYEHELMLHGRELARRLMERVPGGVIYKFHYSDNDGNYGAALEHGGLFRRLPCFRVSHH